MTQPLAIIEKPTHPAAVQHLAPIRPLHVTAVSRQTGSAMAQLIQDDLRSHLALLQGMKNAFSGNRIAKPGRIADQQAMTI